MRARGTTGALRRGGGDALDRVGLTAGVGASGLGVVRLRLRQRGRSREARPVGVGCALARGGCRIGDQAAEVRRVE